MLTEGFIVTSMNVILTKEEKLLLKVTAKSMGKSDVVAKFLYAIGFVRQHGGSSDIALAVMDLDSIELKTQP